MEQAQDHVLVLTIFYFRVLMPESSLDYMETLLGYSAVQTYCTWCSLSKNYFGGSLQDTKLNKLQANRSVSPLTYRIVSSVQIVSRYSQFSFYFCLTTYSLRVFMSLLLLLPSSCFLFVLLLLFRPPICAACFSVSRVFSPYVCLPCSFIPSSFTEPFFRQLFLLVNSIFHALDLHSLVLKPPSDVCLSVFDISSFLSLSLLHEPFVHCVLNFHNVEFPPSSVILSLFLNIACPVLCSKTQRKQEDFGVS